MAGLVVITRSIEDAHDYAEELNAQGVQTFIEPMLAIEPVDFDAPGLSAYDGILLTSANAVQAYQKGEGGIDADIPVYCVGKHTAKAAEDAGFTDVISVDGTGADLLVHVLALPDVKLLKFVHICGDHVAFPLVKKLEGEGVQADSLVVYRSTQAEEFSVEFLEVLKAGKVSAVTFFSKRTAEAFVRNVRESDSESLFSSIKSLSISEAVVECVRVLPWHASYVSKTPDRAGMMQLLEAYVTNKGEGSMSKNGIQNAEEVIEAFGGIRPMAKKIDVAVTTVQGWKKRNVIPATRKDQILEAAQEHDVDLSDLIDGANVANENSQESPKKTATEVRAEETVEDEPVSFENSVEADDEGDVIPEEVIAPARHTADSAEEKILRHQADSYDPKPSVSAKYSFVLGLIIILGLISIAAYFWQQSNAEKAEAARIKALEEKLSEVEEDVQNQGFLGNIIPKDLNEQIANLQKQAKEVQESMENTAQVAQEAAQLAQEKAKAISEDVLAEGAGSLNQRINNLEVHLQDITGKPVLTGMLERVEGLQLSPEGNDMLARSVVELDALFEALQLNDIQGGSEEAINNTLNVAREQSDALGQTFSSVPQQDLKAAAMLLGMAQLRSSLNRDNDAFDNDLALLKKLVGEENAELNAALDRLAPHASEGVLTPAGLSSELRTFAGDAVAASLAGEDVSVQERAKARMNELFQVEKDGELITGTDTQASLARADKLLASGDIEGAIAAVQGLDGDAASALAPWLSQANVSLQAQKAQSLVSDLINNSVVGGKLINNEETGINIYTPARPINPNGVR